MADENEQFKNDAAQIEAKLKEGVHRIEEVNVQPSTQAYADNRAGENERAGGAGKCTLFDDQTIILGICNVVMHTV